MLSFIHRSLFSRLRSVNIVAIISLSGAIAFFLSASAVASSSVGTSNIAHQAVIEKRFLQPDQSVSRARLVYNDQGYRLVPLSEGNEFEMIVNTDTDTVNIIDRKRETITEIDLAHEVASGPQLITLPQIRRLVKLPGQLDSTPCLINGGHKTGLFIVEGLELEVWSCNDEFDNESSGYNDTVIKQHYSPAHGRVVYSLFSEGFEYHMQDIEAVKSEELFAKPKNFRDASIEEFFGIIQPIVAYVPSESSQKTNSVTGVKP